MMKKEIRDESEGGCIFAESQKVAGGIGEAERDSSGLPAERRIEVGSTLLHASGKNVVLIGGFKEYVSLLFFKGALVSDPRGILVAPGQLQSGRQIRFTSLREIVKMESSIKTYIYEAIEVEQAGLKVALKKHSDYIVPEELQKKLDELPALKTAFEALTPGRQRGYMFHIAKPKQARTRKLTVEKCIPRILEGKGLNDG